MIVDEMHNEHPELLKDQYWNQVVPEDLPYTVASEHYRKSEPKGSAENFKVKQADAMYANISVAKRSHQAPDDAYADYVRVFFMGFESLNCVYLTGLNNIHAGKC